MAPLVDLTAVHTRPVGVVRVAGHDRLTYLHSLLSQHLENAAAGAVADFLYLDHKANPLAEGRAVLRSGDVLLVVPVELVEGFADALDRFRFLMDVEVSVEHGWSLASVRGPDGAAVPGMRSEPMTAAPHGPGMVVHDRSGGADLLGPAGWVAERAAELDLPEVPAGDWAAWRIGAGIPVWGAEISGGRRPQELGLLPTHVHLRKGCYPGQETIAKTWNLGRPRRALARLRAEGVVAAGDPVDVGGRSGTVTSAAATGQEHVALALLPLDRDGGVPEVVAVGDVKARVEGLVGADDTPPGA